MDLKDFIRKCEEHDWNYHRTDNIFYYQVEKELRYQLRRTVEENPQWAELYCAFEQGLFG